MTYRHTEPASGRASLAVLIHDGLAARAALGPEQRQPAGFPIVNNDVVMPHDSAPQVRREDAGDHVIDRTSVRLRAAASSLRLAQERVAAVIASGRTTLLPDAITAARDALNHLISIR
jgi:hypothetical protein